MSSEYDDKEKDTIPQNFEKFIPSIIYDKENSEIQTSINKKGKSCPLPEEVVNIFLRVKTYYKFKNEIFPCLFLKVRIRK
jgi:hypothetical protein